MCLISVQTEADNLESVQREKEGSSIVLSITRSNNHLYSVLYGSYVYMSLYAYV